MFNVTIQCLKFEMSKMVNLIIHCIFKSAIFSRQSAIWRPDYLYFWYIYTIKFLNPVAIVLLLFDYYLSFLPTVDCGLWTTDW